jgi:hypothetical protein
MSLPRCGMKRSLSLILLLATMLSASAFGDHLYLAPNCCGDNFGYNYGSLSLSGGTDPFFLSADGYMPGSTAGGRRNVIPLQHLFAGGRPTA